MDQRVIHTGGRRRRRRDRTTDRRRERDKKVDKLAGKDKKDGHRDRQQKQIKLL